MIIKNTELANRSFAKNKTSNANVFHLINGEHFSGAERVQDLLAMALPDFGFDVNFVCLKPGKFNQVRQSECPAFEQKMAFSLDIRVAKRIARIAQENDCQILHAHTPRTLMIGRLVAQRLKCPLVYHVHSPVGRDSARSFQNKINTWVERWGLAAVDRMICVSNSLGGYMQELGHSKDKIRVVSNGVAAIDDLPERSAPEDPWTIGTMALFRPRKGTEVMLEALSILKDKKVNVHMRAIGPFETPEYEAEIMKLVERLDVGDLITWTGFQTDVNAQLAMTDVFVLPSLYGEGLPMVVLEAMANGVPVVASRVEGIPEAVRDNVDGLIFEPGSAADLADKLESFLGNQQRWLAMSQSSLERQRSQLSEVSMARGVAAVYDELLA